MQSEQSLSSSFHHIIIIGFRPGLEPVIQQIQSMLQSIVQKCEIVDFYQTSKDNINCADLLIIVGGDGSLLRCAHVFDIQIPIVVINAGRVGFLSSFNKEDIKQKLPELLAGKYNGVKRSLLSATLSGQDFHVQHCCLNEVVIHPDPAIRVMEFEVFIDDNLVFSQRSDGIILCTPTGSTAYALSAGGAVLDTSLEAIQIVPINAYSLSHLPIVTPMDSQIRIVPKAKEGLAISMTCDGQNHEIGQTGSIITVGKSNRAITTLHEEDSSIYKTCLDKLFWR